MMGESRILKRMEFVQKINHWTDKLSIVVQDHYVLILEGGKVAAFNLKDDIDEAHRF